MICTSLIPRPFGGFRNVATTACLQNTITGSVDTSVDSMYCGVDTSVDNMHALWSIDIQVHCKEFFVTRFIKLVY